MDICNSKKKIKLDDEMVKQVGGCSNNILGEKIDVHKRTDGGHLGTKASFANESR